MQVHAYKHARLMAESESRVEMAAYSHAPEDKIVRHLLGRHELYRRWESEHDRLMRTVSEHPHMPGQVTALRATAFSLVHRRALFEYTRERQLTGVKRRRLFGLFYGCRDYTNAVLNEHGNYVRCSSSYLCTQHLAEHLMQDAAFSEPLQLYEQWHQEYFANYCDCELALTPDEQETLAPLAALQPLLKHRLAEAREAIIAMPRAPDREWREVQIRKPNGDTQRMKAIFGAN
jgi:hypothetical protein